MGLHWIQALQLNVNLFSPSRALRMQELQELRELEERLHKPPPDIEGWSRLFPTALIAKDVTDGRPSCSLHPAESTGAAPCNLAARWILRKICTDNDQHASRKRCLSCAVGHHLITSHISLSGTPFLPCCCQATGCCRGLVAFDLLSIQYRLLYRVLISEARKGGSAETLPCNAIWISCEHRCMIVA